MISDALTLTILRHIKPDVTALEICPFPSGNRETDRFAEHYLMFAGKNICNMGEMNQITFMNPKKRIFCQLLFKIQEAVFTVVDFA